MKQRLLKDHLLVCSDVSIGVEPTMNSSTGKQPRGLVALREHLHLLEGGDTLRSPCELSIAQQSYATYRALAHDWPRTWRPALKPSRVNALTPAKRDRRRRVASSKRFRRSLYALQQQFFCGTGSLAASHCDTTNAPESLTCFTTVVGWLAAGLRTGFAELRCAQ